ncbi:MAG: HPr family phosphocarrier protein [Verrucomicrobiota bacterium]|nr:HPr family phosphocarrier protein [Verrucomicrobiota bacterium]
MHARPAAEFARRANSFRSEISLVANGERFSATSLIDIMRAGLGQGATATIEAHGTDAEEAVNAMAKLLEELQAQENRG